MVRLRRIAVLLCLPVVAAACTRGDDPGPSATVPTAVSSTPSSRVGAPTTADAAPDPFAVPEAIDAAYVNRVLTALYAIDGDVTRDVLARRELAMEDVFRYVAIYAEPQRSYELEELRELVTADLSNVRQPPGNRRATVSRLTRATAACILVEVTFDFSELVITPDAPVPGEVDVLKLVPTASGDDVRGLNPTKWAIADAEVVKAGGTPSVTCT